MERGTGYANVNSATAYQTSFGLLPDETVYSDPCNFKSLRASDMEGKPTEPDLKSGYLREQLSMGLKALTTTTGGVGTAGNAMVPVYLDPQVVDQTRKNTPMVEIIPRVTNQGKTADYNNITAKGAAYTAVEDAATPETNTTTDRFSTAIKYTYAVGRVTGQAIATYPSYMLQGAQPSGGAVGAWSSLAATNAKQFEVLVKTKELREMEEDLIINGNATTSGTTIGSNNADGTEYTGIIDLMSTTNTVDKNTAALGLDDMELAIREAFDDGGRPTVAVASSDVVSDIRKLLFDAYRLSPADIAGGSLNFGIPSAITYQSMVGPITILPSMFMSNTSGSKAIYFLDMSVVEMRVLQDVTYEDLAKNNDSEKFLLKVYESLIIRNTAFCSSITEISGA